MRYDGDDTLPPPTQAPWMATTTGFGHYKKKTIRTSSVSSILSYPQCEKQKHLAAPTFSMTENVSWYLVIVFLMFQETLAVSSPSGWSMSPAMSIRSIPGQRQSTEKRYNFTPRTVSLENKNIKRPDTHQLWRPSLLQKPAPLCSLGLQQSHWSSPPSHWEKNTFTSVVYSLTLVHYSFFCSF